MRRFSELEKSEVWDRLANHRDGGRDPTELELAVQPANTARPVDTTPATIIPPSRLWAATGGCSCSPCRLRGLSFPSSLLPIFLMRKLRNRRTNTAENETSPPRPHDVDGSVTRL